MTSPGVDGVVEPVAGMRGGGLHGHDQRHAPTRPGTAVSEQTWPVLPRPYTDRQWAIVLLGRYFTVTVRVRAGQPVVDRGPYRWVRHSSYSGVIVTCAGTGLALGNRVALVVLLVVSTAVRRRPPSVVSGRVVSGLSR